jgi:hypothetical protein
LAIKHPFVSLITDVGGPTYIQPTHWNSPLNAPPFRAFDWDAGAAAASFGIPSSASWAQLGCEFLQDGTLLGAAGAQRGIFDFTYVDSIRLGVSRASNANTGAVSGGSVAMRFQYMASGFPGSWYSFDATGGSAPFLSMATGNNASLYLASANGLMWSASVPISAAAKALPQPLTTRIAGVGGNGSAIALGKIVVFGL